VIQYVQHATDRLCTSATNVQITQSISMGFVSVQKIGQARAVNSGQESVMVSASVAPVLKNLTA